jgi:hypothetical protein
MTLETYFVVEKTSTNTLLQSKSTTTAGDGAKTAIAYKKANPKEVVSFQLGHCLIPVEANSTEETILNEFKRQLTSKVA